MIDRFHCPIQRTEGFSFGVCAHCKHFTATKNGAKVSVKCRKNRARKDALEFESAFILHDLGRPYQVEIIEEETP